jgi:uncharacterized protein
MANYDPPRRKFSRSRTDFDLEGFTLCEIANGEIASGEIAGSEITRQPLSWLAAWLEHPDHPPQHVLRSTYSLSEQIWRGFLPEAQTLPISLIPDFHRSYQTTYIERDIRLMANVQEWPVFSRFVRLLSALTAQEINHAQLGRDIGITPQTATNWTSLLVATCQWHELEPWYGNAIKRLSRKPKGHLSDSGQACHSLSIPNPAALLDHPACGALIESAVVGDIRRQIGSMASKPTLYHWRTHAGAEVDLVLAWNNRLHPIEIKAASHPGREAIRGITAFRATYPDHANDVALIIAPSERTYAIAERCFVVPWNAAE